MKVRVTDQDRDMTSSEPEAGLALDMRGIRKTFPGTVAVDGVDFLVSAGEVHALIGENGAGKSTLMKILAGAFPDYEGEIRIGGRPVTLHSPAAAKRHGVGMIYQELNLARPIGIAENLLAGRLPVTRWGLLDRRRLDAMARGALERVGLDLDPSLPVEDISPHEAQLVEIAKALDARPCILVLDEPTSALSREEAERLFGIIRQLRAEGLAIVYISHHLPDVLRLADRVTVLRDGRRIATRFVGDVTQAALVEMMVGRAAEGLYYEKPHRVPGEEILSVRGLTRIGFFHDVSFGMRAGEIVGIGGLAGSGRTELARALVGLDRIDRGAMILKGRPIRPRQMREAIDAGLAYLPEDRKTLGLALSLSTEENLLAARIPRLTRYGFFSAGRGADSIRQAIDTLQVHPPDPSARVGSLSGGNQQKVLVAKWLAVEPDVLILDEPTRGVDIGAKVTIHRTIEALAERGRAVLLISSDLPELATLSDRILILRRGRLIGELGRAAISEERILLAANGGLTRE
jgi:ABC-type sugar transport system ATPase subunit